mmetsp:Transcript_35457/g.52061  ORF Transcript_35457/g.52061 Transcript_35457/m.52061 type:complete len:748 (+) Transcript_35457:40-2283(+)
MAKIMLTTCALVLLLQVLFTDAKTGCKLANGFVNIRSDVCDRADIANDLKDIQKHLVNGDFVEALKIYEHGKYSFEHNETVQNTGTRTLKMLSTSAFDEMKNEPTYNFIRFGLADKVFDDMSERNIEKFGHEAVMEAFGKTDSGDLPYYTIVVLNLFPYIVHKLWQAVEDCDGAFVHPNTDEMGPGVVLLDEAIAYYIGKNQTSSDTSEGYSIYALAQFAGSMFGKADGAALVNLNMKELYEDAMKELSIDGACQNDDYTSTYLHGVVNRMISQMNVVFMQMLIFVMTKGWQDQIKLYAKIIVSQASRCKPSAFRYLKAYLVDTDYDPQLFTDILESLQDIYSCLGFTCEDIGAYNVDEVAECADVPDNYPIAGYVPLTKVHSRSMVDLDILEIKYLTQMGNFTSARRIYAYGKHTVKPKSEGQLLPVYHTLQGMATSSNREILPYLETFQTYWGNKEYANKFVEEALGWNSGKYIAASNGQRYEIVTKTIQYQVVYMYALQECYRAADVCDMSDQGDEMAWARSWDECVALLVGSLEGPSWPGGDKDDGMLHFNLADQRAMHFYTADLAGYAKVNRDLMENFRSGRDALIENECEKVRSIVRSIQRKTFIPLIQSIIRYAVRMEGKSAPFEEQHKSLAAGEAFAKSILPIVDLFNSTAASVLTENMIMEKGTEPVKDGPQAVADALASVLDDLAIDCEEIGRDDSAVDICKEYKLISQSYSLGVSRSTKMTAFTVMFLSGLAAFCF